MKNFNIQHSTFMSTVQNSINSKHEKRKSFKKEKEKKKRVSSVFITMT